MSRLLALCSLLLAPRAEAQLWPGCSAANEELFISFADNFGASLSYAVTVYDASGAIADAQTGLTSTANVRQDCDWIAETNGAGNPGASIVDLPPGVVYTIEIEEETTGLVSARYTYVLPDYGAVPAPGDPCLAPADRFYCPNESVGNNDDVYIVVDKADTYTVPAAYFGVMGPNETVRSVEDLFDPADRDRFILPYHNETVCTYYGDCTTSSFNFLNADYFITKQAGDPYTPLAFDWTMPDLDLEQRAGKTWEWGEQTVRFQEGRTLLIRDVFAMDETTLTAAVPAEGWLGLRLEPGASGDVRDAFIGGVRTPPGPPFIKGVATVVARDADLELRRTTLLGVPGGSTTGVISNGPGADVKVLASTLIQGHDGVGLHALNEGSALVKGGSEIIANLGGGASAFGTGSIVRLNGAEVLLNEGAGALAQSSATVLVQDNGIDTINNNRGGLDADDAQINAGTCAGTTCAHPANNLLNNALSGFFDARSLSGSVLFAEGNFWGVTDSTSLVLPIDAASVLTVEPLAAAPGLTGGASSAKAGGAPERTPSSARALAASAARQYDAGDAERAYATLAGALTAVSGDADRRLAFGVATRMLYHERPAALMAWMEAHAATEGARRPWAMRALFAAHVGESRTADARALADDLARDYAGTEHEPHALYESVRLALRTGDVDGAQRGLAALDSHHPETPEAEAAGVLVALAGGSPAVAARGRTAETSAKTSPDVAPEASLSLPSPNPARRATTLALTLPDAARVDVEVFDLLGRAVVAPTRLQAQAGRSALEVDIRSLSAGVYLARVTVSPEAGAPLAFSRRFTVVR